MTDDDRALLDRLRSGAGPAVVEADDPEAVAAALVGDGARRLAAREVASWAEEAAELRARADAVLAAEEVVAGAEVFEHGRRSALLGLERAPQPAPGPASPTPPDDDGEDHVDADRQAVRFALAILVPAQLAGAAVYLADRTLLAVVAPAAGLAVVLAVALAHRPRTTPASGRADRRPDVDLPRRNETGAPERTGDRVTTTSPASPTSPTSPAVRAAEAHLRRQQAAWKLAWWERGLRPVDVATWVGRRGEDAGAGPATLVVVDDEGEVDEPLVATMTAALPAAVRVVVVRSRPA